MPMARAKPKADSPAHQTLGTPGAARPSGQPTVRLASGLDSTKRPGSVMPPFADRSLWGRRVPEGGRHRVADSTKGQAEDRRSEANDVRLVIPIAPRFLRSACLLRR